MSLVPIILAGGSGTRLWPLSRENRPKQLINIVNDDSLIQNTIDRISSIEGIQEIVIVTSSEYKNDIKRDIKSKYPIKIIAEPVGRNSAPAITLAALYVNSAFKDSSIIVLSSDHYFSDDKMFIDSISTGLRAIDHSIVTIGITPEGPNTNYGYIKSETISSGIANVKSFIEKPSIDHARELIKEANIFWNAGIFIFNTEYFIDQIKIHANDIYISSRDAILKAKKNDIFIDPDKEIFATCRNDSIDYALLEKSKNIKVSIYKGKWTDIGSWDTYYELLAKDKNGNVLIGDIIPYDTKNSMIYSDSKLIVTNGVENLFLINSGDSIFVSNKSNLINIKDVIQKLKDQNREELKISSKVYRPWGWYDSLDFGKKDQVKRIEVYPGQKLSVQKHFKREEHWVVVEGQATVIRGDEKIILEESKYIFIPKEEIHSLQNETNKRVVIIEVQYGSYLGEDDIVRFSDIYGRSDAE